MSAALARANGASLTIETLELDEPEPGEVRSAVGRRWQRRMPYRHYGLNQMPLPRPAVLGHEGAGVVERIGPGVTQVKAGDHVLMNTASCGACLSCSRG